MEEPNVARKKLKTKAAKVLEVRVGSNPVANFENLIIKKPGES
jgi:hypothetical protein